MNLICHVCKTEFPIPNLCSKLWFKCPKCGTMIQLWGYREPYVKSTEDKPWEKMGGF